MAKENNQSKKVLPHHKVQQWIIVANECHKWGAAWHGSCIPNSDWKIVIVETCFWGKRRWIVNPRHYVGNNCCSLHVWLGRSIVIFSMIDCNWKSERKGGRNGRGLSLLGINDEIKFCR
jgi:hypothetical protein